MSLVWNILNTLQIVNTFPLYNIKTPENLKQVLLAFDSVVNMKVINKESVYNFIMGIDEETGEPEAEVLKAEEPKAEEPEAEEPESDSTDETQDSVELEKEEEEEEKGTDAVKSQFTDFGVGSSKTLETAM